MTQRPQGRGKYDDGTCFICSNSGGSGEPLVASRWRLYRISLCQHHVRVVRERMQQTGRSRDEVLEGLMDSVISGLGLGVGPDRGRTRARTPEEAGEVAAGEVFDDQDAEDLAYAARIEGLDKCAVCTVHSDRFDSMAAYDSDGTTIHLCPRDEQTVLKKMGEGLELPAAVSKASAQLMRQIMPPSLRQDLTRRHFERNNDGDGPDKH